VTKTATIDSARLAAPVTMSGLIRDDNQPRGHGREPPRCALVAMVDRCADQGDGEHAKHPRRIGGEVVCQERDAAEGVPSVRSHRLRIGDCGWTICASVASPVRDPTELAVANADARCAGERVACPSRLKSYRDESANCRERYHVSNDVPAMKSSIVIASCGL
jgi:hypothetical protein